MAIYEYECPVCGQFEVFQRMSEPPLSACPQCAKNGKESRVQRLISASAFVLKGGGWYKTDYASSSSSSSNGHHHSHSKPAEGSPDTEGGKKEESKPESKSSETKTATASAD